MKYTPVILEVEAEQFDPTVKPWPVGVLNSGYYCTTQDDGERCDLHDLNHRKPMFRVVTAEGEEAIQPGDWIVTGKYGRSVVRSQDFAEHYRPLDELEAEEQESFEWTEEQHDAGRCGALVLRLERERDSWRAKYDECKKMRNLLIARLGARAQPEAQSGGGR